MSERSVYAKTAAATAKTRPLKEMTLPDAAPPEDSGAEALVEALLEGVDAPDELGATLVPATGAVELTPGTMGTTSEVGAMGVAVGTTTEGTTVDMNGQRLGYFI